MVKTTITGKGMKKAVVVMGFALLVLVSLLSGCTSSSLNQGSECCVLGVIGVILFIILIAYLLGGKKTVVQTQQMAPASAPIIIREEPKETPKQESKSDRRCPDCGRIIPDDAELCPYCGKKFKKHYNEDISDTKKEKKPSTKSEKIERFPEFCSNCGSKTEEVTLFCIKCGKKLI